MAKIQDPKGPFVWKDSYVYAADLEGKMLAHPLTPGLIGKVLRGRKRPNRQDVRLGDCRNREQ